MPENDATLTADEQRLTLLFQQARAASIAAAVSAIATTLVFLQAAPGLKPVAWLLVLLITVVMRFGLYQRFDEDRERRPASHWLRRHGWSALAAGAAWGAIPLIPLDSAPIYLLQLQMVIPAFVLMAAITSYGVYFSQYLAFWSATSAMAIGTRLYMSGTDGIPEALLFALFAPVLVLTAKRYAATLLASTEAQQRAERLVQQLRVVNDELHRQNDVLARQQDLIEQEEALAQHVFRQLTLGGDHRLPGIHTWNQAMGSLSGDLTQTARGPAGQTYVFLGDFTGHGLPAALGALPASSVFLAMAAKGLPVGTIANELNNKLRQLLPVGYFCCAVLLELSADRSRVQVWNGGLPEVLIRRRGRRGFERIASHSLPLGVLDEGEFESRPQQRGLAPGDLLYAYTDGLTEAESADGERWGVQRLEDLLVRRDLATPRLPTLIHAVLDHVNLAPASDDISVVEIEAAPLAEPRTDAA